MTDLIIK